MLGITIGAAQTNAFAPASASPHVESKAPAAVAAQPVRAVRAFSALREVRAYQRDVLALIEFEDVNTLFLTRLIGLNPKEASLDWIGMKVKAKYLRNSKFQPTDVYFVPAESE